MVTLVTGVPGWLGNTLLSRLIEQDEEIQCLVQEGVDCSALSSMDVKIIRGDIRNPETLSKGIEGVDTVYHLAAVLHSRRSKIFFDVNTEGTINVIEQSLRKGVKRFLHVSSDSAAGYSNPEGKPKNEDDPSTPATPYGRSKLLAENAVQQAHDEQGLKTTIIRPCWIYGPGQPSRGVYFMKLVAAGRFPLFGDGQIPVSMSYVEDVARALILAEQSKRAVGEKYFIADEEAYSLERIFKAITHAMGENFRPLKIPSLVSRVSWRINQLVNKIGLDIAEFRLLGDFSYPMTYSIEKAKKHLDYRPTMIVEEGMKRAVDWSRSQGDL